MITNYRELEVIQQFIDKNNFNITVDGVIEYFKDFYEKDSNEENDYVTACKYCEKKLDVICSQFK